MGAVTEEILELLSDMAFRPYRIVYGYFPKEYSSRNLPVLVHRLRKKGFIEKEIKENEICLRLTELGYEKLKEIKTTKIDLLDIKPSLEQWDNFYRVVIFDIPEKNKRVRHVLREMLKVLGFQPLQKSVWISKRNYTKELRRWVEDLQLDDYVVIFETKDLGLKSLQ